MKGELCQCYSQSGMRQEMHGNERQMHGRAAAHAAAPFWMPQMRKSLELLYCITIMGVRIQSSSTVSIIGK